MKTVRTAYADQIQNYLSTIANVMESGDAEKMCKMFNDDRKWVINSVRSGSGVIRDLRKERDMIWKDLNKISKELENAKERLERSILIADELQKLTDELSFVLKKPPIWRLRAWIKWRKEIWG